MGELRRAVRLSRSSAHGLQGRCWHEARLSWWWRASSFTQARGSGYAYALGVVFIGVAAIRYSEQSCWHIVHDGSLSERLQRCTEPKDGAQWRLIFACV